MLEEVVLCAGLSCAQGCTVHPSTEQVQTKYRASTEQVQSKYRPSTEQVQSKYRALNLEAATGRCVLVCSRCARVLSVLGGLGRALGVDLGAGGRSRSGGRRSFLV